MKEIPGKTPLCSRFKGDTTIMACKSGKALQEIYL